MRERLERKSRRKTETLLEGERESPEGAERVTAPLCESGPALYGGSELEETTFPHQLCTKLPDPVIHPVCVCVCVSLTENSVVYVL